MLPVSWGRFYYQGNVLINHKLPGGLICPPFRRVCWDRNCLVHIGSPQVHLMLHYLISTSVLHCWNLLSAFFFCTPIPGFMILKLIWELLTSCSTHHSSDRHPLIPIGALWPGLALLYFSLHFIPFCLAYPHLDGHSSAAIGTPQSPSALLGLDCISSISMSTLQPHFCTPLLLWTPFSWDIPYMIPPNTPQLTSVLLGLPFHTSISPGCHTSPPILLVSTQHMPSGTSLFHVPRPLFTKVYQIPFRTLFGSAAS